VIAQRVIGLPAKHRVEVAQPFFDEETDIHIDAVRAPSAPTDGRGVLQHMRSRPYSAAEKTGSTAPADKIVEAVVARWDERIAHTRAFGGSAAAPEVVDGVIVLRVC